MTNTPEIEVKTISTGREIFDKMRGEKSSLFSAKHWEDQVIEWCMANQNLKIDLLRLVEVFPVLKSADQVANHLAQYFPKDDHLPTFLKAGVTLSSKGFLAKSAAQMTVKQGINRIARHFIAATNACEAIKATEKMKEEGASYSIDILGEATTSERQADEYTEEYINLLKELSKKGGEINVSLKPSSFYSQFDPINPDKTSDAVKSRLRKIFSQAREIGAFVNVDIEKYAYKDLIFRIFMELTSEDQFKDYPNFGIAMQAYLKKSEEDVRGMIEFSKNRPAPVTVRLVKGAYWDYEVIHAKEKSWEIPVFTRKWESDANFEKLTEILLQNHAHIRTAIASHNIRSISHAISYAEGTGVPAGRYEFQILFGMGDEIRRALVALKKPVRVYTPCGDLIPGMAYLVRRILENSSNESFLMKSSQRDINVEELLKNPVEMNSEGDRILFLMKNVSCPHQVQPANGFQNAPDTDFSRPENIKKMGEALKLVRSNFGAKYPLIINGKKISAKDMIPSLNPAAPSEIVGYAGKANAADAEDAILAADAAFGKWSKTTARERANILSKAARIMEERRFELSATMVVEEGKEWREADADTSEAIDFLNYYGHEMLALEPMQKMPRIPGETNEYGYRPHGAGVVIAPWNFPLAILTGMSSAAIVAGNTIVLKPASQAAVIAAKYMEILTEAGLPPGVCNFLPGPGGEIGDFLVKHPKVKFITFTGSREVGLRILRLTNEIVSSQNSIKKVICELGGKNAVIIDHDADLDEAIPGVLASAFSYQGQKCSACSRVIVLKDIYDDFVRRLVESANAISLGPPEIPGNMIGPLIDKKAKEKTLEYIEIGKKEGKLAFQKEIPEEYKNGFFVSPAIFTDISPSAVIAQEEIFAPVVAIIKVDDFDEAIKVANGTDYALTGGIYSRSPKNIERVKREFQVGNLYINRKITGAIVNRQPFGGFKMSGVGSKAGGPDYLKQFLIPVTITENIMRHGYAPIDPKLDLSMGTGYAFY